MATGALLRRLPELSMADFLQIDHLDTVILLRHFQKAHSAGDSLLQEKLDDAINLVIRLHSQAEMDVLYPFVEKTLGSEGKTKVKESLEEHTSIEKSAMEALKLRKKSIRVLSSIMDTILTDFTEHVMKEENEIFPMLLEKTSASDLSSMAVSFQQAKETAPLDSTVA